MGPTKNIVLIGFKNVGKTTVGKALANQLGRKFIDLDKQIETLYQTQYHEALSCRQIMQRRGAVFFRELEHLALKQMLQQNTAIISLGGGTPLPALNQALMNDSFIIHITAERGIVFERIMLHGRPAFFPADLSPVTAFNQLWEERTPIYEKLANLTIHNNGPIKLAVAEIIQQLGPGLGEK